MQILLKKQNKKLVDKIARSRELKAGINPSNPRARAARNRIRRGAQKTAKNIYKGTAAGTGVATGSTAAALLLVAQAPSRTLKPQSLHLQQSPNPQQSPRAKHSMLQV